MATAITRRPNEDGTLSITTLKIQIVTLSKLDGNAKTAAKTIWLK